jgi:catechol 2,3-dioxygenase-like lactoylglutathione lyase family enzyme
MNKINVKQREQRQRLGDLMKSSRDILIQTSKIDTAAKFYEKVLGFQVIERSEQIIGFETGSFRFFIDKGESYGPVFEFYVPDLKHAKKILVENGCRIEVEDPKVPRCYVRDPFGLIFNLAEKKNSK